MAEVKFLMREAVNWEGSLVITAFPTAGSAASIAGHYLRRKLNLPLVGSIHLEDQSPVAAIQDGISTSPLRIYGAHVECKLGDERCPTVYLLASDLALQPASLGKVGDAILQETRGARMVLCLDSVARDAADDSPDVFCASPDGAVRDMLATGDVTALKEAIIVGMTGQILLGAEASGLPAGALLVEAAEDLPDGRAAAKLIQAVDRLLPSIDIDAKPLLEEAMELEKQIAAAAKQAERAQGPRASHTFI